MTIPKICQECDDYDNAKDYKELLLLTVKRLKHSRCPHALTAMDWIEQELGLDKTDVVEIIKTPPEP